MIGNEQNFWRIAVLQFRIPLGCTGATMVGLYTF